MTDTDRNLPAEVDFDRGNEALIERIRACLAHPLSKTFQDSLDHLVRMARGLSGGRVRLGHDFAPLSFSFCVLRKDGSLFMNGALILHGAHDGGGNGGAPTYSVNVNPTEGWTLHT